MVEAIVMDKYLCALPYEAKSIISHSAPVSALVEAVEQYQATTVMLRMGKKSNLSLQDVKQILVHHPKKPTQGNTTRQVNIQGLHQAEPEQR